MTTQHQDTSTERSLELEGGKYTIKTDGIYISVLRYGEPWRNHTGDKMFSCLLDLVFDQQAALASRDEAAQQQGQAVSDEQIASIVRAVEDKDKVPSFSNGFYTLTPEELSAFTSAILALRGKPEQPASAATPG